MMKASIGRGVSRMLARWPTTARACKLDHSLCGWLQPLRQRFAPVRPKAANLKQPGPRVGP
jgi:hypothetical protein